MDGSLREGGLLWRMLGAWIDLRGAMRRELDRDPSEGRLLFYAMASGAIWSIGAILMVRYRPGEPPSEDAFLAQAAGLVGGALFVRTLALYGLSALAHAASRALGGDARWCDSRAALFWAALVSAPAMVALVLLALAAPVDPGAAGAIAEAAGSLIFALVAAACIAETHGFASFWRGLAVVIVVAAVPLSIVAVVMTL